MEDTLYHRVILLCKDLKISKREFEEKCGLSNGFFKLEKRSIGSDKVKNIVDSFPNLNIDWLLYGKGEVYKDRNRHHDSQHYLNEVILNDSVINYDKKGVPYFNVDFILGYDIIENNKNINPDYYIDFPEFNAADCWVNITGKSMEPTLWHGDKISIRLLEDWNTYILYGEIYAIVTNQYRTVKIIRKSKLGEDYLRLVPISEDFDEQDLPKSVILKMFSVLGCAKKLF